MKPIPQRERTQWEVGVGHAEDAFLMTRQERIDNYTFIYVDPDPEDAPPTKKPSLRAEKRSRRSSGSVGKKEDVGVKSPDREQPPRRQLPRRQCSISNTEDSSNSQPAEEEKNQKGEQQKKSSPLQNAGSNAKQDSPPPVVRPWKTAAARKLLPLSITMKRLNVEITKCDWPLLQKNITQSPKKDREEEKKERVEREARQPDLGYCSPDVGLTRCRWMEGRWRRPVRSDLSVSFSRTAEPNLSPVQRRRKKRATKVRKRATREEALRPAGGASQRIDKTLPLDRPAAVRKARKRIRASAVFVSSPVKSLKRNPFFNKAARRH